MAQEDKKAADIVRLTDELHDVLEGSDFHALVLIQRGSKFIGSNGEMINAINLVKGTKEGWTILLLNALAAAAHKQPQCATDLAKCILTIADLITDGLNEIFENTKGESEDNNQSEHLLNSN